MLLKFRHVAAAIIMMQAVATTAEAKSITILSVIYGTPQTGRICDATSRVASLCSGRSQCDIEVGNMALCSDPDFLSVKQANIKYTCGRTERMVAVSEYRTATIACE